MGKSMRARLVLAVLILLTAAAGLTARALKARFPVSADAAGDALWATMVFLLISFVQPHRPIVLRAVIALAISFAVEFSQLYHAPWIDDIRRTMMGAMILGFTFVWLDLVWYTLGVAIGVLSERGLVRR